MIENDFPALRDAVRESLIGRSVTWLTTAITAAAADAAVTRRLAAVRSIIDIETAAVVRLGAIAVAVAAIAALGLSQLVPPYVATAIPGVAYLGVSGTGRYNSRASRVGRRAMAILTLAPSYDVVARLMR